MINPNPPTSFDLPDLEWRCPSLFKPIRFLETKFIHVKRIDPVISSTIAIGRLADEMISEYSSARAFAFDPGEFFDMATSADESRHCRSASNFSGHMSNCLIACADLYDGLQNIASIPRNGGAVALRTRLSRPLRHEFRPTMSLIRSIVDEIEGDRGARRSKMLSLSSDRRSVGLEACAVALTELIEFIFALYAGARASILAMDI